MTAFREATGRPVLSRASAEKMGDVGRFVVDPHAHRVTAVVLGKGRKAQVVDWEAISGFGPDAVMVESEDRVRAPHDGEIDLDWLGHRVLSDRGFELGAVEDVEFDPESGALTSVHVTKGGAVTADRVLGAGSYAVVVEDPR